MTVKQRKEMKESIVRKDHHTLAMCHTADEKGDVRRGSQYSPGDPDITACVKAHPTGLIRIRDLLTEVQFEIITVSWNQDRIL